MTIASMWKRKDLKPIEEEMLESMEKLEKLNNTINTYSIDVIRLKGFVLISLIKQKLYKR